MGACRRSRGGFAPLPQCGERLWRINVDEDGVVVHLDFGDELGVLADQVLGADIAGELGHFGKEPLRPEDRVAALAVTGRNDDGSALERVERRDQPVEMPARNERHVAEANEDPVEIGRQCGKTAGSSHGESPSRAVHALPNPGMLR